jgi:hypothetical protein
MQMLAYVSHAALHFWHTLTADVQEVHRLHTTCRLSIAEILSPVTVSAVQSSMQTMFSALSKPRVTWSVNSLKFNSINTCSYWDYNKSAAANVHWPAKSCTTANVPFFQPRWVNWWRVNLLGLVSWPAMLDFSCPVHIISHEVVDTNVTACNVYTSCLQTCVVLCSLHFSGWPTAVQLDKAPVKVLRKKV